MERYERPVLTTKAYAQFENVFTNCNKGNEKKCTVCVPGLNPGNDVHEPCIVCGQANNKHAAFGGQAGS